jgi:DNA-binding transcriptional regulator YiaG
MAKRRSGAATKIGAEFIAGMEQLIATAKAGGLAAVQAKHGKPLPVAADLELPPMSADGVVAARKALGVSQPVFARILGASVQSVRAWEQGVKPPSGVARLLIGEIRHDPEYWRKRFALEPAVAS